MVHTKQHARIVMMQVIYADQWIEKKGLEGRTKESLWCSGIIVFRIAALHRMQQAIG